MPSRGRPAASMASSMVVCRRRSSLGCTRLTTRWIRGTVPRSRVTVRWASRRAEESVVDTTMARSAPQQARRNPSPSPAGESIRIKSYCPLACRIRSRMACSLRGSAGRVTGAVIRLRPWITGWGTAAFSRGQRPHSTSVKSISARSLSPRLRSRFRRPISISMHSTFFPSAARQEPMPAVREVLPVPPLPEVMTIAVDIGTLRFNYQYHIMVSQ